MSVSQSPESLHLRGRYRIVKAWYWCLTSASGRELLDYVCCSSLMRRHSGRCTRRNW